MKEKEKTYLLVGIKSQNFSKEGYNEFIKGLTKAVMDYYSSLPTITKSDMKMGIEDIEEQRDGYDIKQKVIDKMSNMHFTIKKNYLAGTVTVISVEEGIEYEYQMNVAKEQAPVVSGNKLLEKAEEIKELIEKNNQTDKDEDKEERVQ